MDRNKVLIVDPDRFFLRFCTETLAKAGIDAVGAGDGARVLKVCAEELTATVTGTLERRMLYQDNEELKAQLRLYELSRSFASVEEPLRVAALGLDALKEVTGARGGFCVVEDDRGEPVTTVVRELPEAVERRLEAAIGELRRSLTARQLPLFIEGDKFEALFGQPVEEGYSLAFLVPFRAEDRVRGFALLFCGEGEDFPRCSTKGAEFLGAQVALAFRAALRFQEAKGLAYIDSLTGLYNQRYLPVVLEKCFKEADAAGRPVSLLFLDLDDFRGVNSRHGHLAGSKTLIEVAWILGDNVRSADTVMRFGGDEFTLVLPATDTNAAREIAERIRRAIEGHVFLTRDQKALSITATIGVATYPVHARSIELLINVADQAMYLGKNTTRNVVCVAAG